MSTIDRINLVMPWVSEGAKEELDIVRKDVALILSCARAVSFALDKGLEIDDQMRATLSFAVRIVEGGKP